MRILITDDQARRYERLIDGLGSIGIERSQIDLAQCANAARDLLHDHHYDLLILDILLPLWPEEEPDIINSRDLLTELSQSENYKKPAHIVGITAFAGAALEVGSIFCEQTWAIVSYSESHDEWLDQLLNCARYLNKAVRAQNSNVQSSVDLVIICALAEPELEEVLKLPWNWTAARPIDDVTFVRDGYLICHGQKISVCALASPRMGMVSTAILSSNIINLLRPRLLAMCGICAGVPSKVNLGDVILADPAWDFQSGKRTIDRENKQFSMAPHQLSAPSTVRSHIQQIRADRAALADFSVNFGSDAPGSTKVVIGPGASGSAVLADGAVVQEIQSQHRELCGVEMEIYGMYAAADSASSPRPSAFALKGVCDFADSSKTDKAQRYAAYASANTLRLLMEKYGDRILDQ